MPINTRQTAALKLPLTGIKCLYRSQGGKKLVVELDIKSLKGLNKPITIDEMVAEARLEYFTGMTRGFTDTKSLMNFLEAE